jgi:uncharacterized protein (DUF924 family)
MPRMSSPDAILQFWFEQPATDLAQLRGKLRRWFMGGQELDTQIRERFGDTIEDALAGKLDHWASDTRGRLALIIILDQFTRGVFRDTPRAYAGDAAAQRLALEAFDRSLDEQLSTEEQNFLIMPLAHSENVHHQERGAQLMARMVDSAPAELRPVFSMGTEQTNKYLGIIRRFGRFPHRNAILGRASTPEEVEFLRDWADNAAPTGARDLR